MSCFWLFLRKCEELQNVFSKKHCLLQTDEPKIGWSCFCGIRCCSTVSKRTKGQFRPHKQHQPYSLNKAAQLLLLLYVVHLDFNLGYATNTDYDAVTVTLRLGVMGFPATGYFICQKLHHITESTFQECSIQIKGTVFQTHCIFRRAQKISKMEG